MTKTIALVGALSNDLMRVASLKARKSDRAAERFLIESKRWSGDLVEDAAAADYIRTIASDVDDMDGELTLEKAERLLMYGVLLQNYAVECLEDLEDGRAVRNTDFGKGKNIEDLAEEL